MLKEIVLAGLIAFAVCAAVCPVLIPALVKIKFGQQVRDDGPEAHLKKQGTPTMGGIAFLLAITVTGLIFLIAGRGDILPVLVMTVGFGGIGFLDDWLKIRKHQSEGLSAKQKLLLQFVLMALFCVYMMVFSRMKTAVFIPFTGAVWEMKWFYPFFVFLVVLGTDNGVNFTDGVDGLCTSVTIVVSVFLTVMACAYGVEIWPVTAAVVGSLMAFLLFNAYPAKVFMGDTGSLALGGFVASSFLLVGQPLLILLVGFIYLAEVISVILQVTYFKKTHGKRIFRMAPLHHHFELGGWSETRVVAVFTVVTMLLSSIALLGI